MNRKDNSLQLNMTLSDFCKQLHCTQKNHDNGQCQVGNRLMCDQCIPRQHSEHKHRPIKLFNELSDTGLHADESVNMKIDQVLSEVKALKSEVNQQFDFLEASIKRMKSVSLKQILDPFLLKSADRDTVTNIQQAIQKNVQWSKDGSMELIKRDWKVILKDVHQGLEKISETILERNEEIGNPKLKKTSDIQNPYQQSSLDIQQPMFEISLCAICLGSYSQTHPPIQLKCLHIFHLNCLKSENEQCEKDKKDKLCPMCRKPFIDSDIKIDMVLLNQIQKVGSNIQILIKMPDSNKTIAQMIDTTKTVSYLVTLVSANTGIQENLLQLQYKSKMILRQHAYKPLSEYNFENNTIIYIIPRIHG